MPKLVRGGVMAKGQTQPINAVFSIYSSTMKAKALSLIGRKMVRHEVA
jgi:hypothetical protein